MWGGRKGEREASAPDCPRGRHQIRASGPAFLRVSSAERKFLECKSLATRAQAGGAAQEGEMGGALEREEGVEGGKEGGLLQNS